MKNCTFVFILIFLFLQVSCTNGLLSASFIFNSRYRVLITTINGVCISSDRGQSCNMRTQLNSGLFSDTPVYVVGSGNDIYAAFNSYMAVSNDGGNTFISYMNGTNGLGGGPFDSANNAGWINTNGTVFLGNDDGFITTTNHGASFNSVTPVIEVCGAFSGSGNFVMLANTGGIAPGLYISYNGGSTFPVYRTITEGLPSNYIYTTAYTGTTIFTGGPSGVGVSYDVGATFLSRTTSDGLGSNSINQIAATANYVFVATTAGLSVSSDNGVTFSNKNLSNGLPSINVLGVAYAADGYLYVVTDNGVAVSTDKGQSFTTLNTAAYFPSNGAYSIALSYY